MLVSDSIKGPYVLAGEAGTKIGGVGPTLSGGVSSLDALNERLSGTVDRLRAIAITLGAPVPPASGEANGKDRQTGHVYRIMDASDRAHQHVTGIESVVAEIVSMVGQ